jgi:hypothetical protein
MAVTIEIRQHPTSAAHQIVKAISRGRVYAVTFAEPFPTIGPSNVVAQMIGFLRG